MNPPRLYEVPGRTKTLVTDLLQSDPIHRGEWQAMDVRISPMHATHELTDVTLWLPQIPATQGELAVLVNPDLPWAEEHFGERVSGVPYNPAPSHVRWPYAVRANADHTDAASVFDHTYPERFWPKAAGVAVPEFQEPDIQTPRYYAELERRTPGRKGIRYNYGDLRDVVEMLKRNPATRQAFLPVWFPEDTGAKGGDIRVPCTIGYHFMTDVHGRLGCRYYIRSCDVYRHMINDIYLAGRLTQWVVQQVNQGIEERVNLHPGSLVMYVSSLHGFVGDLAKIKARFL